MAKKKNKLAFPVGVIATILAIIGLVTVVSSAVKFVKSKTDQTELKAEYEKMLKPVVMFDPDPFDDLTKADNAQLLYAAVWNLLLDEEGAEEYSYSTGETVGIVVPQSDIEESFVELFGTEIDIASLHSEIDMSSYDITYDAATKSYILPITGVDAAYTPKVYSVKKQGTSRILSVGYISNKTWADISDGAYVAPEADKVMMITIRERGDSEYVASIQSGDRSETTTIAQQYDYPDEEAGETTEEITEEAETAEAKETEVRYENVTDENGENATDEYGVEITRKITVEENTDEVIESETSEIELDSNAY